jgi:hypothetical protein
MMSDTTSTPSTEVMDAFVQMSSLLTGFNASVLAPTLDSTDLKSRIFETAQVRAGKVFEELLQHYQELVVTIANGAVVEDMSEQEKVEIGQALLLQSDPQVAATGRAVMKAWYLGSWYQPFDHGPFASGVQTVISDQAYVQGLAWKVMQSHAMGNSTWTFGYWRSAPPPLTDFTGNQAPDLDPEGSAS